MQTQITRRTFLQTTTTASAAFTVLPASSLLTYPTNDGERLVVHLDRELWQNMKPKIGFLGGLLPTIPDSVYRELHPAGFRIGHQFKVGNYELNDAIDRVGKLGAQYKLVMSDLIGVGDKEGKTYEQAIRELVKQVGEKHLLSVIWEPQNEPDQKLYLQGDKPIEIYYEIYERCFKTLRSINPKVQIAGPSFASPSYYKYKSFFEFCRNRNLECNYVTWHNASWDYTGPLPHGMDRLQELIQLYKDDLKILENHCDEWGGPPWQVIPQQKKVKWQDVSGTARDPGSQLIYLYYLEQVYKVDFAGRANFGKIEKGHEIAGNDNFLGNIVTADGRPYPAYHVYKMYSSTRGQTRLLCEGQHAYLCCLASKQTKEKGGAVELLIGSVNRISPLTIILRGMDLKGSSVKAWKIPANSVESDITKPQRVLDGLTEVSEIILKPDRDSFLLTIPDVERQEVFRIVLQKE